MSGNGTEESPYIVATKEDLLSIGELGYADYYFKQVNDIDMSGEARSLYVECKIHYDGGHHKILNWKMIGNYLIYNNVESEYKGVEFINCEVIGGSSSSCFILSDRSIICLNCLFHGLSTSSTSSYVTNTSQGSSGKSYFLGCYFEVTLSAQVMCAVDGDGDIGLLDCIVNCKFIGDIAHTISTGYGGSLIKRNYIKSDYSGVTNKASSDALCENISDTKTLPYNIINLDATGLSEKYTLDGKNVLTDAECGDISKFKDVGWWI